MRKRLFCDILCLNPEHLPRQARDKHRESSKKGVVFSRSTWWDSGHVCENWCPAKNGGEGKCCGGVFYHWGALTGFVALLEAGLY